jgi:hypothetical protein
LRIGVTLAVVERQTFNGLSISFSMSRGRRFVKLDGLLLDPAVHRSTKTVAAVTLGLALEADVDSRDADPRVRARVPLVPQPENAVARIQRTDTRRSQRSMSSSRSPV